MAKSLMRWLNCGMIEMISAWCARPWNDYCDFSRLFDRMALTWNAKRPAVEIDSW